MLAVAWRTAGRAVAVLIPIVLAGCNQLEGSGELGGRLVLPGCPALSGAFTMPLDFFAVEEQGSGVLVVRLQQGGRGVEESEGLLLTLFSFETVQRQLGAHLPIVSLDPQLQATGGYLACDGDFESRPAHCPLIRADLFLPRRCPAGFTAPRLDGTVAFAQLGTEVDERVAGTLDLTATDARDGGALGNLVGEFDFFARQGQPYQRFPH